MEPNEPQVGFGGDRKPGNVDEFLESLDELTDVQLLELQAAWSKHDPEAHENAWSQVVAVAARDGLTEEMERVRDAALHWATRGTNVPWPFGFDESDKADFRRNAGPALADAAVAMLLGDRLDAEAGLVLIEPWVRTTGQNWSE